MNYLKEILAFHTWLETNQLDPTTQALWFHLMDINNKCGWAEWFAVANMTLQAKLGGIDKKTLDRKRSTLINKGRIEYKNCGKREAGKYRIIPFEDNIGGNIPLETDLSVPKMSLNSPPLNKQNKTKQKQKNNIYADFVKWYNSQFGTKHKVDPYRDKLKTRLDSFTIDQLQTAAINMHADPYMTGKNDNGRIYATLEYLLRNDKNVDKWLVQKPRGDPVGCENDCEKYEDIYLT